MTKRARHPLEKQLVELNRSLSNVIEQLRVRDEKFAHKPLADL